MSINPAEANSIWSHIWIVNSDHKRFTAEYVAERLNYEELQSFKTLNTQSGTAQRLKVRAIVREVMSNYVASTPSEIVFSCSRYGKPSISGGQEVNFNVSHTHGACMIGVCKFGQVGVDIEHMRRARAFNDRDFVQRFLTPFEAAQTKEAEDQVYPYMTVWTLKEAYTKALGLGLRLPFPSFEFSPSNAGINDFVPYTMISNVYRPMDAHMWVCGALAYHPSFCAAACLPANFRFTFLQKSLRDGCVLWVIK